MKSNDLITLIMLGAVWGASFIFMRIAAPVLGAIPTVGIRLSLAAVVLCAYGLLIKKFPDVRTNWRRYLLLGALNNAIPFLLITSAITHLNASISAILNATTPLFTAIVSTIWIKEPFNRKKALGLLLGIIGVATLMGWSPLPVTPIVLFATGQALLGALSYGIGAVYTRRQFAGIHPIHSTIGQLLGSTVILTPIMVLYLPKLRSSPAALLAVVALALLCTALAYLLYFRLITNVGPVQAVTVTFLVPLFSVIWGVIFLHEPLSIGLFVGLGIILFSEGLILI